MGAECAEEKIAVNNTRSKNWKINKVLYVRDAACKYSKSLPQRLGAQIYQQSYKTCKFGKGHQLGKNG
jgi:hypothetical protein